MLQKGAHCKKVFDLENIVGLGTKCHLSCRLQRMALKSTIFKVKLSVANLNIHHYEDYNLTIARHPSETDLRMMYRLVAFVLHCHEGLEFTKGLSSDAEPDLWKINYDGSIDHWIELGQPEEKRLRQMCSKAKEVSIFTYNGQNSENWFKSIEDQVQRFDHLNITHLTISDGQNIEDFVERGMVFDVNIDHDQIWFSQGDNRINLEFRKVY